MKLHIVLVHLIFCFPLMFLSQKEILLCIFLCAGVNEISRYYCICNFTIVNKLYLMGQQFTTVYLILQKSISV